MKPSASGRRINSCMAIQVPKETPAIQQLLASGLNKLQPVQCTCSIGQLPGSTIPITLAASDASEVEAQD